MHQRFVVSILDEAFTVARHNGEEYDEEVARHQSAKSLELRAVMNLSRLWQVQGRREKARQILAEMYSWFAAGFDTENLQEAKALLAELSRPIRPGEGQ